MLNECSRHNAMLLILHVTFCAGISTITRCNRSQTFRKSLTVLFFVWERRPSKKLLACFSDFHFFKTIIPCNKSARAFALPDGKVNVSGKFSPHSSQYGLEDLSFRFNWSLGSGVNYTTDFMIFPARTRIEIFHEFITSMNINGGISINFFPHFCVCEVALLL